MRQWIKESGSQDRDYKVSGINWSSRRSDVESAFD